MRTGTVADGGNMATVAMGEAIVRVGSVVAVQVVAIVVNSSKTTRS